MIITNMIVNNSNHCVGIGRPMVQHTFVYDICTPLEQIQTNCKMG